MHVLTEIKNYEDESGNIIFAEKIIKSDCRIIFKGKNNRVILKNGTKLSRLIVKFDGNNGTLKIGENTKVGPSSWNIRIGEDSVVEIGNDVSTTEICIISAVEGSVVKIGDDVMIASHNQLRADDGHAIYDIYSGKRINPAKNIYIGNHVWLAYEAVVLGGSRVGDGTVVGFRSLVTGSIPNNVIAAGVPAKIIKKNVAWERPHLSLTAPPYRPDSSVIKPTLEYWNETRMKNRKLKEKKQEEKFKFLKGKPRRILKKFKKIISNLK